MSGYSSIRFTLEDNNQTGHDYLSNWDHLFNVEMQIITAKEWSIKRKTIIKSLLGGGKKLQPEEDKNKNNAHNLFPQEDKSARNK